jgi:hypothetical protein
MASNLFPQQQHVDDSMDCVITHCETKPGTMMSSPDSETCRHFIHQTCLAKLIDTLSHGEMPAMLRCPACRASWGKLFEDENGDIGLWQSGVQMEID